MAMDINDINRKIRHLQRDFGDTIFVLQNKGLKYFQRVWLAALLIIFIPYKFFYQSMDNEIASLEMRIKTARAANKYAKTYNDSMGNLLIVERRLPPASKGTGWLSDISISSLKEENITPDSVSSVHQVQSGKLIKQSISVDFEAKFPEIFAWLYKIEHDRYLIHVDSLQIKKEGLDENKVHCTLSTLIQGGSGGNS
jgi:hypothetical protein